jgi:drug/metabolite transporter (DMT)-like permease
MRGHIVIVGLLTALGSALCSGVAAVLQARGVGRTALAHRTGPALAIQLARSGTYLVGLGLVGASFLLSLLALHQLPVFAVGVARATSLGVTALLAWPLLGVPIRRRETVALLGLGVGLVLVMSASRAGAAATLPAGQRWGSLAMLVALVLLALVVERRPAPRTGVILAGIAGLDFGLVGLSARSVTLQHPLALVSDPAAWTLGAAALHGLLTYANALQRTSVTSATGGLVGVETLTGAVAGVLLLGDGVRHGWAAAGVFGFALALCGALVLARSDVTAAAHRHDFPGPEQPELLDVGLARRVTSRQEL